VEEQAVPGKRTGIVSSLNYIEDVICIAAMVLMALFPVMESVARLFFKTGILASSGITTHLLLITGLLGGMICSRGDAHLAISLVHYVPEGVLKRRLKILCNLLSAFVAVVIAWSSIPFIKIGLEGMANLIGFISIRMVATIIPIAYLVIAVRFVRAAKLSGWKIVFPILVFLLATVVSFPVIAKVIWGFETPDSIYSICDKYYTIAYYVKTPCDFIFGRGSGGNSAFHSDRRPFPASHAGLGQ